ncbi:short chain dehydrogenase domain-containing protein [Trichoderma breve]|uniref:Short chain dehydrogenase domain-containing protein n=1 Tax=Trichoderma breve TaxID=2034170 RepID=A0A9W9BCH2_9HYPO|nr:short chain dehydrogenase domain-containing protein [Trichoderma breve]KAJ4857413.1 short chain dehydrogenase domain-containing protein [Trichoderma breve]
MASFATAHVSPYDALTKAVAANPLTGKSFLITGAGRGVGEHITREIAAAGAQRIGLVGRSLERINEAKNRFEEAFPNTVFETFAADITDEEKIGLIIKTFGVPDVLINNAGHFPDEGPFIKENLKSWWTGFEINILGTATVTQQFLRAKPKGKSAIVLNVSTLATHMRFPMQRWSGYTGSKLGQARIFEHIRFEHPEVRFINCHPGSIKSDGFAKSGALEPPTGMTDGKVAGQFFAWLASDEAEFLSGRFVWAEWDVDEFKAKKDQILKEDLLLTTIDGFVQGW